MATRQDLKKELDALRAKLAEVEQMAKNEETQGSREETARKPEPERDRDTEDEAVDHLGRLLAPHGLAAKDIEALAAQFREEIGTLPENKPLLTALGAFALGFALGRATA